MAILLKFAQGAAAASLGISMLLSPLSAWGGAQEAKSALLKRFPKLAPTTPVRASEIPGLYEVNIYGQAAYTDEKASFLLTGGALINPQTLENLTKKNSARALRDGFLGIPTDKAIKTVYGKGERKLISFENPDCPNCRKQAEIWAANPNAFNATVYTFLVPLQSKPDSKRKSEYIVCSADPAKAWKDWMSGKGGIPLEKSADGTMVLAAGADATCKNAENVLAARQYFEGFEFSATPSFVFENGWTGKGWRTIEEYETSFAKVRADLDALKSAAEPNR